MPVILPPGVVTHPSSSAQNTIQPTSDLTALTLQTERVAGALANPVFLIDMNVGGQTGTAFQVDSAGTSFAIDYSGNVQLRTIGILGAAMPTGGNRVNFTTGTGVSWDNTSALLASTGAGNHFQIANPYAGASGTGVQMRYGGNAGLFFDQGNTGRGAIGNTLSPLAQWHVQPFPGTTRGLQVDAYTGQSAPLVVLSGVSSTTASRDMAVIDAAWAVNTDATRQGRLVLSAVDYNATREGLRIEANGSAAAIGFLGAAAVVQQANASQAAITAVTDSNAKSALQAIYNLLHSYGLAPATA